MVTQNKGSGGWIDFWVVCDAAKLLPVLLRRQRHPLPGADHRREFPEGFSNTAVMKDTGNNFNLFEASKFYQVQGTNQYQLIVEAIGVTRPPTTPSTTPGEGSRLPR